MDWYVVCRVSSNLQRIMSRKMRTVQQSITLFAFSFSFFCCFWLLSNPCSRIVYCMSGDILSSKDNDYKIIHDNSSFVSSGVDWWLLMFLLLIVIYDGVGTYDEMIIMDWGLACWWWYVYCHVRVHPFLLFVFFCILWLGIVW